MKKWKWITGLGFLWVAIISAVTLAYVLFFIPKAEYTALSDGFAADDALYICDNSAGFGILYKILPNGDVDRLYSLRRAPYFSGWRIIKVSPPTENDSPDSACYALVQMAPKGSEDVVYRVVRFSKTLTPLAATPLLTLNEDVSVSGFSTGSDSVYIAGIDSDRRMAASFVVSVSELVDITVKDASTTERLNGEAESIEADVQRDAAGSGALIADAEYQSDSLAIRMDNQVPTGVFSEDEELRTSFRDRNQTLVQMYQGSGLSFLIYFIVCVGGVLLITAAVYGLSDKRRIVYRIIFYEVILFVFIFTLSGVVCFYMHMEQKREFLSSIEIAMTIFDQNSADFSEPSEVYGTEDYNSTLFGARDIANYSDTVTEISDLYIYNTATGEIVFDLLGHTRENISFVYGEDPGRSRYDFVSGAAMDPNFNSVAVVSFANFLDYVRLRQLWFVFASEAIYLLLSVFGCIVLVREGRDIRRLGRALGDLAEGDYSFEKPEEILGWDLKRMWNSVYEIRRHIKSINYLQFMIYKAYYRFAPKNIERILKKDTITDVKSGDAIRLSGTQVMIRTARQRDDDPHEMSRRNEFLEIVERQLRAEDGIFISSDMDLSLTRILFLEDCPGCVRFGVNLLQEIRGVRLDRFMPFTTVVMHRAPFVYGVAGTDEQASAFLSSPDTEMMEDYLDWLHSLRLDVVITDKVVAAEEGLGDLRHIGFICPEKDERIELYEVLDAEETRIHMAKLRCMKAFSEALELYYARDFYFARNSFTDILRDVPEDEVAKWYLFDCERLLNEPDEEFTGALHM